MAFTVDQLREFWSKNWLFDNCLGLSKLAALFPNRLEQDGGQFNSIVKIPVMTEVQTQEIFNQETGFVENSAHEKVVQMKLTENFTSFTRILKSNIPGENWAENKMNVIEVQEAQRYDDHALTTICNGVKEQVTPVKITINNFIEQFKLIEKQARKQKWKVQNGIFLISPKVATIIANSKLQSQNFNLENTSIQINQILNKYNCVEADIDDFGYQIIALLPSVYVWASYVETPLQSGEYTQGPYFGQVFTVINKWFNGEIVKDDKILGMKEISSESKTLPKNDSTKSQNISLELEAYKENILQKMTEFSSQPNYLKYYNPYKLDIEKSDSEERVNAIFEKFKKKVT